MKSPAFQFYPNDFLGSPVVQAMTTQEIGMYLLLLCVDWNGDGFDYDEEELARSCKVSRAVFQKAWTRLGRCFEANPQGRYRNPRLQREREKQREWQEKSSEGGKKGSAKRWEGHAKKDKGGHQMVSDGALPNDDIPFPSPSPTKNTTHRDAVFEEAWAAYPKRPGNSRADSYRKWLQRVKDGADPLAMLEGTRRYARFVLAEGTEQRFIKMAQTFYGQGKHFENDWTIVAPPDSLSARVAELVSEEDAAIARTAALIASRRAG